MSKRPRAKKQKVSVPKLYRMVKQMRPEVKEKIYSYANVGVGAVSFGSVGYGSDAKISNLSSGIVSGTSDNQRVGNQIKIIGIKFQLAVQPGDNTNYFRLVIARPKTDLFGTGGATTVQNVLSGYTSSSTQWLSPVDTDRYNVYYDKRAYLNYGPVDGSTTTTVPKRIQFFEKFIKLNARIQWDQESNISRDIFVMAISDSAAISHPGAVAGYFKIYYTDA